VETAVRLAVVQPAHSTNAACNTQHGTEQATDHMRHTRSSPQGTVQYQYGLLVSTVSSPSGRSPGPAQGLRAAESRRPRRPSLHRKMQQKRMRCGIYSDGQRQTSTPCTSCDMQHPAPPMRCHTVRRCPSTRSASSAFLTLPVSTGASWRVARPCSCVCMHCA
jgi:hypothetical protein